MVLSPLPVRQSATDRLVSADLTVKSGRAQSCAISKLKKIYIIAPPTKNISFVAEMARGYRGIMATLAVLTSPALNLHCSKIFSYYP